MWNKINNDMRAKEFLHRGEQAPRAYASPQTDVFHLRCGGVLCGSFDDDNFTEGFDREDMEDL